MDRPILSNVIQEQTSDFKDKVPSILSTQRVKELNRIITCSPYGIFIFVQYNEKPYPVNGFDQDLFISIVNNLYKLYKDCGKTLLKYFLSHESNVHGKNASSQVFSFLGGINPNRLKAANKHYKDAITLRSYNSHSQYPDSPGDQENIENCKRWFLRFCGQEAPSTEEHWSQCNRELVRCSNLLYSTLKQRLEEFEESATDKQRLDLQKWYYDCSFDCFDISVLARSVFGIFRQRRNQRTLREATAYAKSNLTDLKRKYQHKLQMSQTPVDPYKVLVETIDAFVPY